MRVIIKGSTIAGSSRKARKTYLRMVQSVQITSRLPKLIRVNNPTISLSDEDAQWLHHHHDDALVINLSIADFNTQWVLVDNGILDDIFYYLAFQQMKIDKERLLLSNTMLVGFDDTKVFFVRSITLPMTNGTYPQQLTKEITFLVVDCSSTYNTIIGRPTLNAWRAATSTYYLLVKFQTEYGVGEAHGDQMAPRECYIAILEIDDHL